jgi:hypothetical protein
MEDQLKVTKSPNAYASFNQKSAQAPKFLVTPG